MAWRSHWKARVDPSAPRAFASCDNCSDLVNHCDLKVEMQMMGAMVRPTGFLVCSRCLDRPSLFLGSMTLPADPVPITQPRPVQYGRDAE